MLSSLCGKLWLQIIWFFTCQSIYYNIWVLIFLRLHVKAVWEYRQHFFFVTIHISWFLLHFLSFSNVHILPHPQDRLCWVWFISNLFCSLQSELFPQIPGLVVFEKYIGIQIDLEYKRHMNAFWIIQGLGKNYSSCIVCAYKLERKRKAPSACCCNNCLLSLSPRFFCKIIFSTAGCYYFISPQTGSI